MCLPWHRCFYWPKESKNLTLSESSHTCSLDSKSKLSHGLTSDHYWSLLYHCFYLGSYLFFTCFLILFSFWSLLVFGRLTVIEGDWRGLTRLDWQDLRSIIKGRKCSNEKVARADGVLSTYWNRFMKYIDYCTICTPSMPHNYIQGARVNWPTARC